MNKKRITFSLSIPEWMYNAYARVAYSIRKWKYKLNPNRCSCCGKKMYVSSYEIEHIFENGQRLMVHNLAFDSKARKTLAVCPDCIANKLETEEWTPRFTQASKERDGKPSRYNYRFWRTKKCDVTGKDVPSYKDVEIYPYIDMTFCTLAWNWGHVSKEAVIECVRKGKIRTSHWGVYDRKKMAPMNHKRLFIDDNGDLM